MAYSNKRVGLGSKLMRGCHRRPRTQQERKAYITAVEQGVKVRGARSPANLSSSWDDIPLDKAKAVPYNIANEKKWDYRPWKNRAKARHQWERRGNVMYLGYPVSCLWKDSWRCYWKKVKLD